MAFPDYYAILEVSRTATPEEIKLSYRRLARRYHPDVNRETSDARIKLLNEAYSVLSDRDKRLLYDIKLLEAMRIKILQDIIHRQRSTSSTPRMTWKEGMQGFVREFKKAVNEES